MVLVATQVKRRRGTTAENDAFTGAEGEIVVDTERHELRVHDGVTQGGFRIGAGGSGALVIGQILEVVGTADYTPEGCLLADGAEYTKSQFPDLWADFLTGTPKLQTCTYTEYANQIAEYGFCDKFAVDTTNETFKVPTRNKYRKLVKKIVNSDSWANIYDDGWVEQGGIQQNVSSSSGTTVTLLVEMSDTNYITIATANETTDLSSVKITVALKTTTTFKLNIDVNRNVGWQVSGYAPIPDSTANITREFVVVANGTLNQEQMDWSAWASSLASRATTDMNNITSTGKETVVGLGIPDYSAGVDITWTRETVQITDKAGVVHNSEAYYIAPADGMVVIYAAVSNGSEHVFVNRNVVENPGTNVYINARFSVSKGDEIRVVIVNRYRNCQFFPFKGVIQ